MPVKWTKEELDKSIDNFIDKYGRIPKTGEFGPIKGFNLPTASPIKRIYGSISKMWEKRKIIPIHTIKITKKELDKSVDNFIDKYNRTPIANEFGIKKGFDLPSRKPVDRIYGTINKMWKERKITPTIAAKPYMTKNVLDEKTKVFIKKYEIMPTKQDMGPKGNKGLPDECVIIRYYNTITNYQKAFGFTPFYKDWNKNEIIKAIKPHIEHNIMLSKKQIGDLSFQNHNFPCSYTIDKYFPK